MPHDHCLVPSKSRQNLVVSLAASAVLSLASVCGASAPQTPPATPVPAIPSATAPAATAAEAEAMRARIRALEAELKAAQARVRALEAAAAGAAVTTPAVAGPVAVTAANALTSDASFLRFARESYATEFPPKEGEAAAARQRRLEHWAAAITREWRKPIHWLLWHGKSEIRGDTLVIQVVGIDEATGGAIGNEFELVLDAKQARRYTERLGRTAPPERWMLQAVFVPKFVVNMQRQEPGVFDKPPFIGPGIEMRSDLVVESFTPAKAPVPEKTPTAPATPAP
ncbi:MAG: hypothetical protein SGJ09_06460 [Phycisphaerae bacterium]|nr:hypothetical protein [Phycisphaerae bacterium]